MQILFLIIGLIIGIVIGFLFARQKAPVTNSVDTSAFDKKISSLETENNLLKTDKELLRTEIEKQKTELNGSFEKEKERLLRELKEEQQKFLEASTSLEKSRTFFRAQEEKINEQKAEIENLQKKLTTEFENIANKILDEKSKKFTEQNKSNLETVLNPLKDRIKEFEEKVDKTYKAESTERITLKAEIKQLVELNKQVSDEANNLTKALKGDNKAQGNWGEVLLEKILERSGLSKDRGEYNTEVVLENNQGEKIRPDAVVYLPDNKHIIVDSKVSLVAYQNYVAAESEEHRGVFLKEHIKSLKNHITLLSEKHYESAGNINTPDFVLMFLPIESSFGIAVQADQELFSFAWDKKVVLVSPSTLLATLRTIASIWKQEKQTKNTQEIARLAGSMYDKFVSFLEDLNKIEQRINQTQEAYSATYNKLKSGTGNLIRTSEKIKELGAKTSKNLPQNLSDKETETEDL